MIEIKTDQLINHLPDPLITIDSHTEGEITRLLVSGIGHFPGDTMVEKLQYFQLQYDHIRCLLTKEPRGSRGTLTAVCTESVSPEASFGLIFMDARRYPHLCGHATIGAVASLTEIGSLKLDEGQNLVSVDTPSGIMTVRVTIANKTIVSLALKMVPSFVYQVDQKVQVEGFGEVVLDLVCTGGYFAMVNTDILGIEPVMKNQKTLTDLGMKIIDAANEQLIVRHPENPTVNSVDVTKFYNTETVAGEIRGRGMVIYGESHMDRSPCGTGTAAKLALLRYRNKIRMGQTYTSISPIGTTFTASIVEETRIGEIEAVVAEIKGRAWITGVHHFYLDKTDPFSEGYLA
ncbi:MAG: hypothetical protein HOK67_32040 [Deltaproteobacteria bacterium]|nr:hypothetical protein [Deltaproteobacteria bacterium]MBT4638281.1 hypothetical protein [Deltaproteobacteria bacterium]MBT6504528.1 hypothetical protein [Deltaproteobacteria bacterium]MBT6610904.1 hypothetical protein [Deltaproteobacteria bacterium]